MNIPVLLAVGTFLQFPVGVPYTPEVPTAQGREARIAELNDHCRAVLTVTCAVIESPKVKALDRDKRQVLYRRITDVKICPGVDVLHSFGAFLFEGEWVTWVIDYYDNDWEHRSVNPADNRQTMRVLTILFHSEY